jgi:colicin import membrane protein
MNRLQKKCFIASAAFHGGLFAILLFGSAMMSRQEETDLKVITLFNPDTVSDAPTSGGGSQSPVVAAIPATKPAPTPPEIKPVEPTPPQIKPEPPKPVVRQQPKPIAEPKPKVAKNKPVEDLTANPKLVSRKPIVDTADLTPTKRGVVKPSPQTSESAQDTAARDARRKAQREFASAYKTISKNLSSSDLVMPALGGGSSGQVSANYRDIIFSKYYNAWSIPLDVDDHAGAILAKITIARDGSVISAKIIKRSGNSVLDRSVQNALDTVTFIEPFPEGSSDKERTVTIQFEPQAKRQTG